MDQRGSLLCLYREQWMRELEKGLGDRTENLACSIDLDS